MSEGPSRSERLASAYKRLVASAEVLSTESSEFAKPIERIDAFLSTLNLRLITWQKVVGGEDEYDNYWSRDVGYARVRGEWRLAIRTVRGNHGSDDHDVEQWPFTEAPPSYRIEALERLPDLLEELIKNTDKTAKKLKETTVEARELATALTEAAKEVKQQKGRK